MESSQYFMAWAGYLAGALGCLLVWLRMTRNLPWIGLRRLLQISAAAVLLTPWAVAPERTELAPALMVAVFDSLQMGPEAFMRAGIPLLWVLVLAWGLTGLYHGVERALHRKKAPEQGNSKERVEPKADV